MCPLVTSPRSAPSRFEIAFSVVVLPAFADRERHPLQDEDDVVVDDLDVADREVRGGGSFGNGGHQ
jgi:hypothetical protein